MRTALLLARPAAHADRARFALIALAMAAAGGLLLAATHIARHGAGDRYWSSPDDGTTRGIVFAAVLLLVPVLALALQALRVGSIARDRRLAALRLAGATPRDVRMVAAAEAGAAALTGGLLAGGPYLLIWVGLGVLPAHELALMDSPDLLDIAFGALIAVLAGGAGALAGAVVQERVVSEPLAIQRRGRESSGRLSRRLLIAGLVLVLGVFVYLRAHVEDDVDFFLPLVLLAFGGFVALFAAGPRCVRLLGRRLRARGGAERLLAGYRLEAAPAANGRVLAVLFACGFALGFEALFIVELRDDVIVGHSWLWDQTTFLMVLATTVTVIAAGVAVLTLVVGAADQLLDARRPLATLAVMGADERTLASVLRRQLASGTVLAAVAGVLVGCALLVLLVLTVGEGFGDFAGELAVSTAAAAAGSAAFVGLAGRLAARLLRPRLRAAMHFENLRSG